MSLGSGGRRNQEEVLDKRIVIIEMSNECCSSGVAITILNFLSFDNIIRKIMINERSLPRSNHPALISISVIGA